MATKKSLEQLDYEIGKAERESWESGTKTKRQAAKKRLARLKEAWRELQRKTSEQNPSKIPVGKFIPARLNPDGTIDFVVEKGKHKGARRANPKGRAVKNVAEGFYAGGVFHPIRHSSDYRPEALSGPEGTRARSGVRSASRKKAKPAARKKAKKRVAKRKR